MIRIVNFASGSKGNFTLIEDGKTRLVIDCGFSKKAVESMLNSENLSISDIDFVLFTHSHKDHILGEENFEASKKYALSKTLEKGTFNVMKLNISYQFGDFKVTPIKTSHDTLTPCGFKIEHSSNYVIVYITDTGTLSQKTIKSIRNANVYIFESNHDEDMLFNSGRPHFLIDRIYGPKGHLSNILSAHYMAELIGNNTEAIYLAHLSEECNTPELALDTYYEVFNKLGVSIDGIKLDTLSQREKTIYVKN